MTNALVKVTLESTTGIFGDAITNSFAVEGLIDPDLDAAAEFLALRDPFVHFYNGVPAGGLTYVASFLSPVISRLANKAHLDVYEVPAGALAGATPLGSPVVSHDFQLEAAAAGGALPSEVAMVCQLRGLGRAAAPVEAPDGADVGVAVDRPKQRRTGRVYVGPLNQTAVEIAAGVARPSNAIRDTLRQAIVSLEAEITLATGAADLAVWSRQDGTMRPVVEVATDDAFDTQRRRGERPTMNEITVLV